MLSFLKEEGVSPGLLEELKRFRENIRHHFSWKALALCRDKKTRVSILVLYVSRTAFHGIAAVYKYLKKGSGKTPGME